MPSSQCTAGQYSPDPSTLLERKSTQATVSCKYPSTPFCSQKKGNSTRHLIFSSVFHGVMNDTGHYMLPGEEDWMEHEPQTVFFVPLTDVYGRGGACMIHDAMYFRRCNSTTRKPTRGTERGIMRASVCKLPQCAGALESGNS